jgi:hypothetical protein
MDRKTMFNTKEDFERADEEMRKKRKWGRWTLDKKAPPSLDIQPYSHSSTLYPVPLFKRGCEFPRFTAWLGHWAQHLHEKSWMSHKDLWDFVDAAQDIYRREAK